MTKKKNRNKFKVNLDVASDNDTSGNDSDAELQEAFEKGELNTGLSRPTSVPAVKKQHVYNAARMSEKLTEIKLPFDWLQRLDGCHKPAAIAPELEAQFGKLDVPDTKKLKKSSFESENELIHNDFKREMLFYRQAQTAVLEEIPKLHKLGIPTKRPEDYFCEMAKSQEHMEKIRSKLVSKQIGLERSEKLRKLRDLKKYGKQIQTEVLQKRQKEKREMMDKIKKFRKGKGKSLDFLEAKNKNKKDGNKSKKVHLKRREYKDIRYGYGGQKKRSKYNTAESSSGFQQKSKGNKRAGKAQRMKMKGKKKI